MPEERDIEKTLRAWARRRREDVGAPVELDPATRRLLQAEVSRLKGESRQTPGLLARLLWGSPWRLALNLAAAAIVLVAGAFLLPRFWRNPSPAAAQPAMLAQNDRKLNGTPQFADGAMRPKDELSAPQSASQPLQDASKKAAGEPTPISNGPVSLAYNRSMIEAPAAPAASTLQSEMPAKPPTLFQDKLTVTDTAVYSLHGSASATTRSLDGAVIAQKFFRLPAPTGASSSEKLADTKPGLAPVLSSFRLEQTGGQLRVIDADGSIYTGSLTAQEQELKSDVAGSSAPSRSFRVSGTNLTRNQFVVFTGNLVFDDQSPPMAKKAPEDINGVAPAVIVGGIGGGGGGGGGGFGGRADTFKTIKQTNAAAAPPVAAPAAVTAADAAALPALLNFRIEGRALIGTNEIQINAAPTQP